jgi:hypothetical protein
MAIDGFIERADRSLLHEKVVNLKGSFQNHPLVQQVKNL